jgi:hypothetical protein
MRGSTHLVGHTLASPGPKDMFGRRLDRAGYFAAATAAAWRAPVVSLRHPCTGRGKLADLETNEACARKYMIRARDHNVNYRICIFVNGSCTHSPSILGEKIEAIVEHVMTLMKFLRRPWTIGAASS